MRRGKLSLLPFAILGLYMIYSLGPIFWLVLSSLKSRQDLFTMPPKLIFTPDFSGYQAVFGVGAAMNSAASIGLAQSLLNSILVSIGGTVFATMFGTLAGYAASRFRFRGRDDFMFFALSTRMIPATAVLVFYHVMFARLGLSDTVFGLVIVTTFINLWLGHLDHEGIFRRRSNRRWKALR